MDAATDDSVAFGATDLEDLTAALCDTRSVLRARIALGADLFSTTALISAAVLGSMTFVS